MKRYSSIAVLAAIVSGILLAAAPGAQAAYLGKYPSLTGILLGTCSLGSGAVVGGCSGSSGMTVTKIDCYAYTSRSEAFNARHHQNYSVVGGYGWYANCKA